MPAKKEYKIIPAYVKLVEGEAGVVEAIISVFGNIDYTQDIIKAGAFRKTINETGLKVKVLDAHNSYSVLDIIGKPLEIREVSRKELPDEITDEYPDATGGVYTKTQFLMDTPEGAGAYKRMKAGVIDEWSFGFQAVKYRYDKLDKEGEPDAEDGRTVRILEEIKLFEYSPVLWGANPATTTISAKDETDEPEITLETIHTEIKEIREAVSELKAGTLPDDEGGYHVPPEDAKALKKFLEALRNDHDQKDDTDAEPETDPLNEPENDPLDEPELDPLTQDMFNLIAIEKQKNKTLTMEVERG